MGSLQDFDPTPANNLWMSRKKRRPKESPKAKSQDWYKGVFNEASTKPKTIKTSRKIEF